MKTMFTLLLCILALAGRAQEESLAFNLKKGETYTQAWDISTTVAQQVMGQQMSIDVTMRVELSYLVKEKSAEHYDIDLTFDRITMNMAMPQGNMSVSSESEDTSDLFSQVMAAIKGVPVHLKMSARGKLIEIDNLESIYASIPERFPKLPAARLEQVIAQAKSTFGNDLLNQNMEAVTFPDKPVARGESWTVETVQTNAGNALKVQTTYTFQGSEGGYWNITSASTLASADKEAFASMNGMQVKSDLNGTASGEIKLDKASGWIVAGKITQKMSGKLVMKGEYFPDGMTTEMEVTSTSITTGKAGR
jgi:hypothetical protein